MNLRLSLLSLSLALATPFVSTLRGEEPAVALPAGVKAVWDAAKAFHEATPTRERIALNGLWRWQPAEGQPVQPPSANWGFFKVPGCWPGISDYAQKDSQTMFAHPAWKGTKLGGITAAWYQRTMDIPAAWAGRRIALDLEYLNSLATVFVDEKKVGEIYFPGGELDLSAVCRPGSTQALSIFVVALPLKGVMLSYIDSASGREVKGTVPRRGLCGDAFLVGTPVASRITDVQAETSVRKKEITVLPAIEGLGDGRYSLRVRVLKDGKAIKEFTGPAFGASDLKNGRMAVTEKWMPADLWDLHTPQNTYDLEVSLADAGGHVLDTAWKTKFGFREFWIDGRDFYLNGTRIYLSAVPLDNAEVSSALATYEAARESLERLKSFGTNYVYTHNYGCDPGSHLSFTEVLRAADDVGMLVGFSQPHFSHYEWKAEDADQSNGYARHAEYYVRAAGTHPSIVMYAMSHNATGYDEDMNPELIDGKHDPRESWGKKNVDLAMRVQAIVERLDPGRIVYHHASGNLGVMHDSNFYLNFAPVQEVSDWFEHWAAEGVKPAFTCEYGVPFSWDWTMYRGWYNGKREFGSGTVPWEFCLPEWNSQFYGDRAYRSTEPEKANLRWEAKQLRAGNLWHRWDFPNPPGSPRLEECQPVLALYLADNWRAFRTWGVSGISPWGYGEFWNLRDGANHARKEFKVDWEKLQRPGFSPDYAEPYDRMDLGFERADWIPTVAGQALLRNNRPLLAYIAGKGEGEQDAFTVKDHNYLPGGTVAKQVIVINDSREPVTCEAEWSYDLPKPVTGKRMLTVKPGSREQAWLTFDLPATLAQGKYDIRLKAKFSTGEVQEDRFTTDILPKPAPLATPAKIALFDPERESRPLLDDLGLKFERVEAGADLSPYDVLIVGKHALKTNAPAPDISRVKDGLKVIIFEQTSEVLEQRFGFRVAEYGLRQAFPRVPDHPALAGLTQEQLHDWRGDATILPDHLKYVLKPQHGPTVEWCGMDVAHVWRCGNRGSVASVLIEKPARGDFMPIIDGGFGLQYSPLMEYHEGKGLVVFCQMDVTGRKGPILERSLHGPIIEPVSELVFKFETDPAAKLLVRNLLQYVSAWKSARPRKVVYAGDPAGKAHLEAAGFSMTPYAGAKLSPEEILVIGAGGGKPFLQHTAEIGAWLKAGGHLLTFGATPEDLDAMLAAKVTLKKGEHISAFFEPAGMNSAFAGIGPSEVYNRDPREIPLVSGGAQVLGDGVLAKVDGANFVLCQIAPWQFEGDQLNLRRTRRCVSVLAARLLANMGAAATTPLLERFHSPLDTAAGEKRWLTGLYLDQPIEWDYPYRFFRW